MTLDPPAGALAAFIVGTRAQLIKVAPVIVACESAGVPARVIFTGQHRETMDDLIAEFGIRAPREVVVEMHERATIASLVAWAPRAYIGLVRALRELRPQGHRTRVLVHGDTLSTVIGALAARRVGLPVYHVESGLTSGKLFNPFPEELARRIVFRLTDVALCPGPVPAAHMSAHHRCRVVDTHGNTIEDAVRLVAPPGSTGDRPAEPLYLVASLHRFQNIFESARLAHLVDVLVQLSAKFKVYFVLHPATKKRLEADALLDRLGSAPGIVLSPRLGYQAFLSLASGAECVLTDGGSNQEELAVLGVPTIVMRAHTERADGLGENALMEAQLGDGLPDFILDGRVASLRRTRRDAGQFSPSAIIAGLMLQT